MFGGSDWLDLSGDCKSREAQFISIFAIPQGELLTALLSLAHTIIHLSFD